MEMAEMFEKGLLVKGIFYHIQLFSPFSPIFSSQGPWQKHTPPTLELRHLLKLPNYSFFAALYFFLLMGHLMAIFLMSTDPWLPAPRARATSQSIPLHTSNSELGG